MTSTREIMAAQAALAAADQAEKGTGPAVPMAHGFPGGFSAEQFAQITALLEAIAQASATDAPPPAFSAEQFDKLLGLLEPIAEVNILMLPMIRAQVAKFEADQAQRVTEAPAAKPETAETAGENQTT